MTEKNLIMKKIVLSVFIMGSFGFYILWQGQNAAPLAYIAPQSIVLSKNSTSSQSLPVAITPVPTPAKKTVPKATVPVTQPKITPPPVPKKTGLYTDGTYTGSGADAYYGTVQVEAIITNGKISDVQFLNYPQDRSTSRRINSNAMPQLTQEAIQAQSANVNGVSGASDTSAAFKQSLASALAQAKA